MRSAAVPVLALMACAACASTPRASNEAPRVRLTFEAARDSFEQSAAEYRRIWAEDGGRIVRAMEAASGLRFNSEIYADTAIHVLVVNGPANSGYRERPMRMRYSYPTDTKKATLIHELGHRLESHLFRRGEDDHASLFLWVYDVWVDLYGQAFADEQVAIEKRRGGIYPAAWDSALSRDRAGRRARWREILEQRRPRPTVIRAGRLLDPASGSIARDRFVTVVGPHITSVSGSAPTGDVRLIDLSGYTVLPGLIDAHVHLVIGGPYRANAEAILNAGFTTVVDLGARTTRLLRIRDSINTGQIAGPRVLAAGMWVGTKNGVCEFNGLGIDGGADAFRARVRENVDGGADVIKVCASRWPADAHARPDFVEIAPDALAAVVATARAAKRMVIAHALSRAAASAVIAAGVDGLAHSAYLDDETALAMARQSRFLIPTLASLTSGDAGAVGRDLREGIALAHRSGVRLVFGTDGGVLPHGRNAEEFLALRDAGIPAVDAIRSATTNAAAAFQLSDSLGAIAAGKLADIIAVEGDPLADLSALQRVRFVMSRGRVVRLP